MLGDYNDLNARNELEAIQLLRGQIDALAQDMDSLTTECRELRAERDALHGALRKHAISDGICYQCGTVWEYLAECEQHAPGCLAAPKEPK